MNILKSLIKHSNSAYNFFLQNTCYPTKVTNFSTTWQPFRGYLHKNLGKGLRWNIRKTGLNLTKNHTNGVNLFFLTSDHNNALHKCQESELKGLFYTLIPDNEHLFGGLSLTQPEQCLHLWCALPMLLTGGNWEFSPKKHTTWYLASYSLRINLLNFQRLKKLLNEYENCCCFTFFF